MPGVVVVPYLEDMSREPPPAHGCRREPLSEPLCKRLLGFDLLGSTPRVVVDVPFANGPS